MATRPCYCRDVVMDNTIPLASGNDETGESKTHGDEIARVICVEDSGGRQDTKDDSSSSRLVENTMDDFNLLWKLRKYLMLLGILAISVTYNAGLTPPGGVWKTIDGPAHAGDPVLAVWFPRRANAFFYCNAAAFAASLVLIILLLSKHVARQSLWLRSMQFIMILDLFSLIGAYAAGSGRDLMSIIYFGVLVMAAFIYVGIHILVSTRIVPRWLKQDVQSVLSRCLSKWNVHEEQRGSSREQDLEEARKFIFTLVIFSATITYQNGLSPPGGFWTDDRIYFVPSTSMLRHMSFVRYNVFVSCNSASFVSSLVVVLVLLSPELSKHGLRSKAVNVCVVTDLLGLVGAYAAGCSTDIATVFYVPFIPVVIWICFALLVGFFVHKPVADWLQKIKLDTSKCMNSIGRVVSLEFGSDRSINTERGNFHASHQQILHRTTDVAELENASEAENQCTHHEQHANIKEGESHEEQEPAGKQPADSVDDSEHQLVNDRQTENSKDFLHNLTEQSIDDQSFATEAVSMKGVPLMKSQKAINSNDIISNCEHQSTENLYIAKMAEQSSSIADLKINNAKDGMPSSPEHHSADNQQIENIRGQTYFIADLKHIAMNLIVVPEEISTTDSNGATNHLSLVEVPSDVTACEIEIVISNNDIGPIENADIDKNEEARCKDASKGNSSANPADEHSKSRKYILLLSILVVSLTYQYGLNAPDGLNSDGDWRRNSFFHLNAIGFVASLVMIIMLLNRRMSNKLIKRYALHTAMFLDLLALTAAYLMGSCQGKMNFIYTSLLLCLVFLYVGVHVLISTHIISEGWKKAVAVRLKHFSCRYIWPELGRFEDKHRQGAKDDWDRRRNLLFTLAILAATVTYQAGMNPPRSVWPDDDMGRPGRPILKDNYFMRYNMFFYANSFSFVSSVVIIILLMNKESCQHGIKSYALQVCQVVGLVGLLIAYAAGTYRNLKQSLHLFIIAVAVLLSLLIQVFLLSSTQNTETRPFGKFMDHLLMCLFGTKEARHETTFQQKAHHDKETRKKHKYLMLLAILAASITYQGGLSPPGGFWPYDEEGHKAGSPVLLDTKPLRYKTFLCFNSISFMASIVIIMLLLNNSIRKKHVLLEVLHLIMMLDLLALMTAFAAGSCQDVWASVYVYALVVGVVMYLLVVLLFSSSIAKFLRPGGKSGHVSRTNAVNPEQQVLGSIPMAEY